MLDAWLIATPAVVAASAVAAYGTFVPTSQIWGRVICRASAPAPPAVALTFDDGPTAGASESILDALADAGAKATFFVIGRNCRRWPDQLRRMDRDGHLIANHTFDHSHYGVFRAQWYWDRQLAETDKVVEDVTGRRPALFRPPMGIKHFHTMRAAKKRGQQVIGWARRARDGVVTTPGEIVRRLKGCEAGEILLLHDGIEPNNPRRNPAATIEALPAVLKDLRDRGLACGRVDELLGIDGYR